MDVEESKYFGLCKCCLRDGCFRCMWVEYNENGDVQNYGEMLNECFALGWEKPDNNHLDQICESCIQQAKDAFSFRKQILTSQDQLNNVKNEGNGETLQKEEIVENYEKEEIVENYENEEIVENYENEEILENYELHEEIEYLHEDIQYLQEDVQYLHEGTGTLTVKSDTGDLEEENLIFDDDDPNDPDYLQAEDTNDSDDDQNAVEENEEFEEVEYLEFEVENIQDKGTDGEDLIIPDRITETKRWPKKKKGVRRSYRNYTFEDLNKSMEAAKSGEMSIAQAALRYNVPRKTVAAKLLMEKRGEVPKLQSSLANSRHRAFIEEIRTLLTYTNATPYKTRTAHYHCAYCSTTGPLFEDADELRTHTRTQHAGERTKSVEQFLKPLWLNEVLKIDIENLQCTVCCIVLISWNDMFKHLKEQHNLDFDEAYTRVIPYKLKTELRCALCKEAFPNYHHLDSHMNAHYNNYMCSECGDTFLSDSRLKKHVKIHKTGNFLCDECGKNFTLEKYRKKHIDMVHKQEQNIKCLYCNEKFHGTYPRHLHVMQCHREKVSVITCELCGKTFDWRPYYLAHIRRKHNNEKKYQCDSCDAQFFMKSELTRHKVCHSGEKFTCGVCKKQYTTKWALTVHFKVHLGDKWRPGVKLVSRKRMDN